MVPNKEFAYKVFEHVALIWNSYFKLQFYEIDNVQRTVA